MTMKIFQRTEDLPDGAAMSDVTGIYVQTSYFMDWRFGRVTYFLFE